MIFKRDVFISYAHIDNMALKEGEHGWVENFHRALEVRLAQLMGERPDIWRDQKLQGNDFFGDEIVEQLPKTALMISIISPRYIKSEWCTKELKEFIESAASGIGAKIGNKSRIFKLIKTAVPYDAHPPEIADTLGYEFYVTDPYSGKIKELNQKCGGELEQLYWTKLDDIAHDICNLLEKVKKTGVTCTHRREDQFKIYLAETSSDLKEQRDMIKRELIEFGYEIFPDCRLPSVESEFRKSVEHFLDQCVLSIHLVGGNYGPVPEGTQKSIIVLQNELAVKKSKARKLHRLIWLLPGSDKEIEDERQRHFIHLIRSDVETQYGADMFETSIEDFKCALHDKLKTLEEKKHKKDETEKASTFEKKEGPGLIYLICDRRDLDHIAELEDLLYQSEFDVIIPAFEGEEEALMADHRENLKSCDAALIYYGAGSDLWMSSVTRDLIKIAGYGRTRPLHMKAVFLAPPFSKQKERFRAHDTLVINGMGGFAPGILEPFIEILKAMEKR